MATPRQKVQVGVFLCVCGVVLVGILVVLSGVQREKTMPLFVEFDETVSGLFPGADVRYRGVPVGRVTAITVTSRNRIRVKIAIRPSMVELRYGVTAQLNPAGITGQLYINLEGGEPEGEEVPANETIPAAPSLFSNLSAELPNLLASITSILLRLDKTLGEEGETVALLQDVRRLVAVLNATVPDIGARTLALLDRVNALAEHEVPDLMTELLATARTTRHFLERNEPTLQAALSSGTRTMQQVEKQLGTLDLQGTNASVQRTLEQVKQLIDRFSNTSAEFNLTLRQLRGNTSNMEFHVRQAVRSLRETLLSAKNLFDYLEQDPSALLTGRRPPARTSDGQRR